MALLVWNESYSVKIKKIDDQHKKLIDMINEFYESIKSKTNNESIFELLMKMKDYSIFHFNTEEEYYKEFNFPDSESHIKEHDVFIDKVNDVERRFNEGVLVFSFELTNFLKDWFKEHILETDMQYVDFYLEKGAK